MLSQELLKFTSSSVECTCDHAERPSRQYKECATQTIRAISYIPFELHDDGLAAFGDQIPTVKKGTTGQLKWKVYEGDAIPYADWTWERGLSMWTERDDGSRVRAELACHLSMPHSAAKLL